MKLHGHARLELTDVYTGEVEVVESDNLITNAVSDIFNGYGGSEQGHAAVAPRYRLHRRTEGFGSRCFTAGCFCTIPRLGAEPGTLFAPAAAGVVGTARCNVVNTTKNTTRGSANLTETNIDPAAAW